MPVERLLVDRPDPLARRARVGEPREAGDRFGRYYWVKCAIKLGEGLVTKCSPTRDHGLLATGAHGAYL